jgi:sarcosine oxidase subunit gamma
MSEITITRRSDVGMITLRGELGELAQAAGLAQPDLRKQVTQGTDALLWMSPDEMLLICDDAPTHATALGVALSGAFATVADVSDARAVFDLTGDGVPGALAKLMPVDFANLAPDEVRRTRLSQVAAAVWRDGAGWRVICFRSVADYVEAALRNAADGPIPQIGS